jgi:hypothetical protein
MLRRRGRWQFGRDIVSLLMGLSGVYLGRGGLVVLGGMEGFLWGIGPGSGGSCDGMVGVGSGDWGVGCGGEGREGFMALE